MNGDTKVITADVMATNGIIHVIDRVLLPPESDDTPSAALLPDDDDEEAVEEPKVKVSKKKKDAPAPDVDLASLLDEFDD